MAKPILVANWKNHPGSLSEAKKLLRQISRDSRVYRKPSLFIAPPLPYFESISDRIRSFGNLASQDISIIALGTHTGMVTPDILKSFGVRLAIVGHSERRALGEPNEIIAKKIKVAIRSGITALLCVGEVSRDQDGEHFEFLRQQLKLSLAGISKKADVSKLMIAYEPIWSIGKTAKDAIKPEDLSQSIIFIKKILIDIFGRSTAEGIPVLYGGSVEPDDAKALWQGTGIKGFLVGHASLDAEAFREIALSLSSK